MKNPLIDLIEPPKKERLNEKIISQIKQLILSKNFMTGQRLPSEREFANKLKVSRIVIREAFRSLENAGLIEIKTGKKGGAFITDNLHLPLRNSFFDLLNHKRIGPYHILETRKAIEAGIIKLVVKRIKKRDIKLLESINKKLTLESQSGQRIREINAQFHITLAEISGNPLLKIIIKSVFEILNHLLHDSTRTKNFIKHTYEKHLNIIDALKKKDIESCEKAIFKDIEHMRKLIKFRQK